MDPVGGFLLLLFLWLAFWEVTAELWPYVIRGIGYLFLYVGQCLAVSLMLLGQLGLVALRWLYQQSLQLALLLYYTVQELRQGEVEDDLEVESSEDAIANALVKASIILNLPAQFSEAEFTLAYRRAIKAAHPDKGGSAERAQAVYWARDVIKLHPPWR